MPNPDQHADASPLSLHRPWRKFTLAALVNLAAAAASAPAQAQLHISSSATNLHYALIDLAPNDGVAPSVDFTYVAGSFDLGNDFTVARPGQPLATWSDDAYVYAPGSLDRGVGSAAHGTIGYDGQGLRADGFVASDGVSSASFQLAAGTLNSTTFTLAPHTGITFSMDVAVDLTTNGFNRDAGGWSAAGLILSGRTGSNFDWYSTGDRAVGTIDNHPGGDYPADLHLSKTATVTWNNAGTDPGYGILDYYVSATGAVSPVPEPGEWAMLGVGAGLLGWRARRRNTARPSA